MTEDVGSRTIQQLNTNFITFYSNFEEVNIFADDDYLDYIDMYAELHILSYDAEGKLNREKKVYEMRECQEKDFNTPFGVKVFKE